MHKKLRTEWAAGTIALLSLLLLMLVSQTLKAQPVDWQVELITLRVANQPIQASQLDARNRPQLYNAETLYLPNLSEPFTIEFGAPYAPQPQRLYYRYQLHGLDSNWIYTDADFRRATYTNLGFGSFQFVVEASTDGSTWQGQRRLNLNVAVPAWLSPWAIAGYLLFATAVFTAIAFIIRARRSAIRQLRASEERLKLSLWGSGDQLWDWDIRAQTLHRHNQWRQLASFPQDRIRFDQHNQSSNIHPLDLKRVQQALHDYLDGRKTPSIDSVAMNLFCC